MRSQEVAQLEFDPQLPPYVASATPDKASETDDIAQPRPDDNTPVMAISSLDKAPRNRDASQSSERHNGITCSIVCAILIRFAELAYGHRCKANIAATCKAENYCVHDDERFDNGRVGRIVWVGCENRSGQPECEGSSRAESKSRDHAIEATQFISNIARSPAPKARAGVEDSDELIGEGGRESAGGRCKRSDVGDWDKEAPFHEVDANSEQSIRLIPKDAQIRHDFLTRLRRKPRADQKTSDRAAKDEYETDNAGRPSKSNHGEETLEHKWEYDATERATGCRNAGCIASLFQEEVAYS